ncbi:MAG: ABC transporter ATP-binding protein [Pirellulales bacterium]
MITVDSLAKCYRGGWFRPPVEALRGVSFDVGRGEIFGLLGANGAGKTTVIKVLLGIVRPTGGDAAILGLPAGRRAGRRRVGYLPENLNLPRHQTAATAMEFYGKLSGMSGRVLRRRSDELLELVGLAGRTSESVARFSKGMRQRLGLAQALLHDPDLLILDEPTDGLDPVGRAQVRGLLQEIRDRGKTVFLNSHLLQEVELVCDRVAILNRGRMEYCGRVADVPITHDTRELRLDLAGSRAAIEAAVAPELRPVLQDEQQGRHVLHCQIEDQEQLDRLIDRLRAADVSILAMARRKATLEDAYLGLIDREETAAEQTEPSN